MRRNSAVATQISEGNGGLALPLNNITNRHCILFHSFEIGVGFSTCLLLQVDPDSVLQGVQVRRGGWSGSHPRLG